MLKVRLAEMSDDEGIRRLLWQTPMRGIVDLVFAREPDYFALGNAQGQLVQTLVAEKDDRVLGLATRAIRRTRVNGSEMDTGYLADFRLHPNVRGGYVLAKGYRLFRQLHEDSRAHVYTALVVEDNEQAMSTLMAGRANFPECYDLGRVLTPLILVSRNRVRPEPLERGRAETLPEIVESLNRNDRQFAPVYAIEDFTTGRFVGFDIEDFILIRRNGIIVAVAGLWAQTHLRQTIALRYTGAKRLLRPLVNRLFGLGLPEPGRPFRSAYMSFVHAEYSGDYERLIKACLQLARERGITHLVVGMHERDALSAVLGKFTAISFAGRMFAVKIEGELDLDGRVPYMEPATL